MATIEKRSESYRIIVSNGMIVYALTRKTEGGKN